MNILKRNHWCYHIFAFTLIIALLISGILSEEKLSITAQASRKTFKFYDSYRKKWRKAKLDENAKMHNYDWSVLKNKKKKVTYKDPNYTIRKGIDVSYYNGTIDWKKVKKAGIDFAFIRLGYRGYGNGSLNMDVQFKRNLKNAKKVGIDVGVYFFSQAINEKEAREEAAYILKVLDGKKIEMPIVYDSEEIVELNARANKISRKQNTKNAIAFCKRIQKTKYEAMIYTNLCREAYLFDMDKIDDYLIWYADYQKKPQTPYDFAFWQYTSKGSVAGIPGRVDLNVQFIPK